MFDYMCLYIICTNPFITCFQVEKIIPFQSHFNPHLNTTRMFNVEVVNKTPYV